ncbi:response regulator protein TodT [mine drainage metagenome]|uniref:Response regulator protein TodT n=1 Tax=mine drainage metagenome TaxID=410659 RepID=A0A1J5QLM3_9ZZZZ
MTFILCVDPSASYCALVTRLARNAGAGVIVCDDSRTALNHLNASDGRVCILMIVADQIGHDETGLDLIRSTRLLAHLATMPILFIMNDRDPDLAFSAMQAGATEIALRSDGPLLVNLIKEFSSPVHEQIQTGRALLVEDSESQAEYVEQLCHALGLDVDCCVSMNEGIECLKRNDYQIALIDIVLHDVGSGLALVRHIRQLPPPRSRMPVLVMSGFQDEARRIEAFRVGTDDFISKPFTEEEFVWRLHRIIRAYNNHGHDQRDIASPDLLKWQQRGLSLRESQVCAALIRGLNDKQIAADLQISFWTVRTHISSIFIKLGVINRRELMARYLSTPGK